jgi:FkbM family methyltransferase
MKFIKDIIVRALVTFVRLAFAMPLVHSAYLLVFAKYRPVVTIKGKGLSFIFSASSLVPYWRARSMFTKEPETIDWIDGFASGEVFYDIGANVGIYTLYAATTGKAAKVIAFEPESQNYAVLNENVFLNNLQDRVACVNIALSDVDKLDWLYLSEFSPGGAIHTFGEALDYNRQIMKSEFKQGIISFSLDKFIETYSPEFPNHIKIDVDGLESKIIEGAQKALSDGRLKSLLIEINEALEEDMKLVEDIKKLGFEVKHKGHAPMFNVGAFSKLFNYVFLKKQ